MQFRSHGNGSNHPITPKQAITSMSAMTALKGQNASRVRLLTRKQRSSLSTLQNPLLWSNFKKKIERLNPDFDIEVVDRSLEPEEALLDLKRKYPELDIGLKSPDETAGFREFLDEMGITNEKLQNMIAMEDNPLSQDELAQLSYILNMRSEHAQQVDKALKAPITNDVRQWMDKPNRFDIATVDTPVKSQNVKPDSERVDRKTINGVKYEVRAFHPKTFEDGVYAVSFYEAGKPKVDKYNKFTQIKASSREDAIAKATADLF